MKILVCGDRNWSDFISIYEALREYQQTADAVIHGACRGADTLAGDAAEALQIPVRVYPANWTTEGPSAGPLRNRRMLQLEHPDLVLAFHNDLVNSKGTKDMVNLALSKRVKVIHYSSNGKIEL